MIKCRHIIFANDVIVDKFSNDSSVISIYDYFEVTQFPGILTPSKLLLVLERTSKTDPYNIDCILKVKYLKHEVETNLNIDFEDKEFAHHVVKMPAFNLTNEGAIEFKLLKGKKEIISHIVRVNLSTSKD